VLAPTTTNHYLNPHLLEQGRSLSHSSLGDAIHDQGTRRARKGESKGPQKKGRHWTIEWKGCQNLQALANSYTTKNRWGVPQGKHPNEYWKRLPDRKGTKHPSKGSAHPTRGDEPTRDKSLLAPQRIRIVPEPSMVTHPKTTPATPLTSMPINRRRLLSNHEAPGVSTTVENIPLEKVSPNPPPPPKRYQHITTHQPRPGAQSVFAKKKYLSN